MLKFKGAISLRFIVYNNQITETKNENYLS